MAREPSLEETMTNAVEFHLENIHTSIPAVVVRADMVTQTVDVQPALNIKMFSGEAPQERPVILNVPLQFPCSKTSAFLFPVQAGDTVLLVFSERGLDSWKSSNGYPSTPVDYRMMDYKDAIAIPGIQPKSLAVSNPQKHVWQHSTTDTVVVHGIGTTEETEIRLKQGGGVVVNTYQAVEINCDTAQVTATTSASLFTPQLTLQATNTTWVGNITHQGNYVGTGIHTFNGIPFETHKHIGVTSGTATSGTPVP